jgi:hypothetical protein
MSAFGGKADIGHIHRNVHFARLADKRRPCEMGQSILAPALISDVDLLCNCQGIIHFNAEITNRALDLSVTKKQLHGS